MQPAPVRDFVVGLFVLAGLTAIAYLSMQVGGIRADHVLEQFDHVDCRFRVLVRACTLWIHAVHLMDCCDSGHPIIVAIPRWLDASSYGGHRRVVRGAAAARGR